ncbi:MAG: hypothetical protein ACTS27_10095 [Phycisphaerales bacterium]
MSQPDAASPLLIVTGITLDAERAARPLAYAVREHVAAWLDLEADGGAPSFEPIVCTDIHWLNTADAREFPTIAIGGPAQNALTAYLADKLPSVFAMDGRVLVQMDLDGVDLLSACWGVDDATTAAAVERFLEAYLDRFMESASARFEAMRG